jgi:soluble lytic murein transglycosylase
VIIGRPLAAIAGLVLLYGVAEAQPSAIVAQTTLETPLSGQGTVSGLTSRILTTNDAALLRSALDAANRGDDATIRRAMASLDDPVAQKIALWTLADSLSDRMSFAELDLARKDLADWPRASRRQGAAEHKIATSGLTDQAIVDWFKASPPQTSAGVMALASAWRNLGRTDQATSLIRAHWRDQLFDAQTQRTLLTRFGDLLIPDDHAKRADMLLFGQPGQASRDLLPLLDEPRRQLAEARLALRSGSNLGKVLETLPEALRSDPSLNMEKVAYLRQNGREAETLTLASALPPSPSYTEASDRMWRERRLIFNLAVRAGNFDSAYRAVTGHGMTSGTNYVDAEFFAGWLALTKLKMPSRADEHFARIQASGSSPITLSRAFYWRGRAAEAIGDPVAAATFYGDGAHYITTFYGQLAAEKAGLRQIELPRERTPTLVDRARFEGRDVVKATKILIELDRQSLFRTFILTLDDTLPTVEECALLVDLASTHGEQELAMRVVRAAAQRGFILPERGYPVRETPSVLEGPEAAAIFGITRQESGFDPRVSSGVGARGMMQIMPATARSVAKRIGVAYDPNRLSDPDYNMRLGSAYLGHMITGFSGSYVLAAAAYNAGPGRPAAWVGFCGDPRNTEADPLDFIECIPFSETRNYVMRVMENVQVYRARLGGGSAPLTLTEDLRRGIYRPKPAVLIETASNDEASAIGSSSGTSTLSQP